MFEYVLFFYFCVLTSFELLKRWLKPTLNSLILAPPMHLGRLHPTFTVFIVSDRSLSSVIDKDAGEATSSTLDHSLSHFSFVDDA